MAQGQGEIDRRSRVVAGEVCTQPGVEGLVALLALRRRKNRGIGRVRRIGGLLPIRQVTRIAGGGKAQKDTRGRLLVALFALHRRVGTQQREAVHVILDLLHGNVPPLNGVTLGAIGTHLPAVNVLVAIHAILAHVGENRLHVTLHTRNLFMHSAQRIFCFVVIKFGNGPDGAPARRGVTVFTRNGQGAVRTLSAFLLS